MWEFWRSRLGKNEKSAMKEKKKRMGKSIDIASQAARMFSAPAEKVAEILAGLREQDQQASTSHVHFKVQRVLESANVMTNH